MKKLSKIKLGTSQDIYSKFLDECRNMNYKILLNDYYKLMRKTLF